MPLSPTLFGLCIDELEEMVVKFVKEEGIKEVVGNVVIMLVVCGWCDVNSSKTKIVFIKSQRS